MLRCWDVGMLGCWNVEMLRCFGVEIVEIVEIVAFFHMYVTITWEDENEREYAIPAAIICFGVLKSGSPTDFKAMPN